MKKLTLTFLTLCAFCALAYAGPEPLASGKEMKEVAPLAPDCPNWTGFYIGGFGAYDYGVFDPSIDAQEDEAEDARFIRSRLSENFDANGAELGGLIGFNYQRKKWVVGLEAAGGYLWLRNSNPGRFHIPGSDDIYALSNSLRSHYLFTVGPRLGYALCKWLPYVTGGMAIGDLDYRQEISETDDFHENRRQCDSNVGWFVGGGLQYALCHRWSVRVQYQYVDLGSVSLSFDVPSELRAGSRVSLREHNASLALIYGF